MKVAVLKKLTLWEFVLLGLGALSAITNFAYPIAQSIEPVLDLFSSVSLLGIAIFVVFGGQLRSHAFFILIVFVFYHLVMSYLINVWADRIMNQDLPPGVDFSPVGSIRRFVFDATVDFLSLLVAVKLTFSDTKTRPEETPTSHEQA